jgi:hypothetical protein
MFHMTYNGLRVHENRPAFFDAHRINESSVTVGSLNNCERNSHDFSKQ